MNQQQTYRDWSFYVGSMRGTLIHDNSLTLDDHWQVMIRHSQITPQKKIAPQNQKERKEKKRIGQKNLQRI